METLSSCYLCGAALNKPDSTYRLGAATVTLCSSCETRLEELLNAADSSLSLADIGSASSSVSGSAETPETADTDRQTATDSAETHTSSSPAPADASTQTDARSDALSSPAVDTNTPPDAGADEGTEEPATDPQAASGEQAVPDTRPDAASSSESGAEIDTNTSSNTNTNTNTSTEPDTERPSNVPESPATGASGAEHDVEITTREYRTLLRLLQNREFPVERAEIEAVAASAYGYSQAKCAAVIDAAVDRGRLTETDGMLRTGVAD
jgi:hypothetical protein